MRSITLTIGNAFKVGVSMLKTIVESPTLEVPDAYVQKLTKRKFLCKNELEGTNQAGLYTFVRPIEVEVLFVDGAQADQLTNRVLQY